MAYSEKEWQVCRAFFERGLTLSEIVKREEVKIKSKSQISKKAASEGWERDGKKKLILSREVSAKQELAAIEKEKETLKETERFVHEKLCTELTLAAIFFSSNAIQNVSEAMSSPCSTQSDFRQRAETILKGKEVVVGKAPETAIQINNSMPAQGPSATKQDIVEALTECGHLV